MSWAHRDQSSRRHTFFRAPALVVTVIVALLAATCMLLGPAGATVPPVGGGLIPNSPPDLLNDFALGSQPTDTGVNAFGQFYPQPSPGTYEGLFTTTTGAQFTALQDLQKVAIYNTLQAFNLPASDTAAVQTWARNDALAQMFTLLDQVANSTNGGSLPKAVNGVNGIGLSSTDVSGIESWLAQVIYRQAELSNDFAGLEYVKWAGLDQTTYRGIVSQLNFDLNNSNGAAQTTDENNLSNFLSATNNPPVDFADLANPSDPTTATEGYCVYVPPAAPSGVSNYPTYLSNIFPGHDTTTPSICFGSGGIGCTISCLPVEPSYQDFQEWGAVDAEATVENNVDYGASANQVGLALGLSAIVGSVAVGTSLAATLIATGAFVGTSFATAASSFAAVANGFATASAFGAQASAAASTAAEAAAGATAAAGVGAIAAAVILFVIGTVEESLQLAAFVNTPASLESILQGGDDGYQSIGEFMQDSGSTSQLFNLFMQATLPTPVDNEACPPYPNALNGPDQCLNPPAPPAPTPGTDPVFSVTPQGGSQVYQSSITWDDTGTGATTTARLVNTNAGNSSPAASGEPDAWFVEQTKDHGGNPFQVTYNTGRAGTQFQSLSMHYTDWSGNDETAYLLWVSSAGEYEFTPESSDISDCISTQGSCTMSPTVDYQYNGTDYSAQVVPPPGTLSGDALTVAPTTSANPTEGSPVTFNANAQESLDVGLTYQWQYDQKYLQVQEGPTLQWVSCGQIVVIVGTGDPCLSAPVDGDGAQITFPTSGVYSIVLTVTDSLGFSVSETFDVTVADVKPTVTLAGVENNPLLQQFCSIVDLQTGVPACNVPVAPLGSPTVIGGSFGHAGLQDVQTLSIDWGDGTVDTFNYGPGTSPPTGFAGWPSAAAVGFIKTHAYALPGSYTATVTATATDQSGATATQTIAEDVYAPTTTTIAAAPNPSVNGQQVTLSATLAPAVTLPSSFTGTPSGTVSFYDLSGGGKTLLGTAIPGGGGNPAYVATLNVSSLSVGSHPLEASFAGDSDFGASAGNATTYSQDVNQAHTKTGLAASANPVVHGQTLTLTAPVSVSAPGMGTPTGSVTFKDGTTTLGTSPLTTTAGVTSAMLSTSALGVGPHSLTATYGGDLNDVGSGGSLTVNVDTNLSGFPKPGGAFNLSKANLAGADLDGVNLAGANVKQAQLANAILVNADLANANLNMANLSGAMLENANLNGADLKQANLQGANLDGAIMTGTLLTGVSWKNATCPDGTTATAHGGSCIGHL